MKLSKKQKALRRRLMEVIFAAGASHIGSSLSTIDLIDSIYEVKSKKDRFILSNGHAAAAYYVVLEKNKYLKNIDLNKLKVHPDRDPKKGIDVSTGSLGQGLPIALGMALASPKKNVYCLISDGEAAEGSIWESLRVYQEQSPKNLKIILSANGWGAYDKVSSKLLKRRLKGFGLNIVKMNGHNSEEIISLLKNNYNEPTIFFAKTTSEQLPFLKDLIAHYHSMSKDDYQLAMKKFS
jgi:transketolase